MNAELHAAFVRALTLDERAAFATTSEHRVDLAEAMSQRLAWWRERPKGDRELRDIHGRLRRRGLDPTDSALVGLLDLDVPAAAMPEWANRLERLLESEDAGPSELLALRDMVGLQHPGALAVVWPLLAEAFVAAREVAGPDDRCANWPALAVPRLLHQTESILTRTIALELNLARVERRLTGDTPQARFQSFDALLTTSTYRRDFAIAYPVLLRQVLLAADQWQQMVVRVIEHYLADEPAIAALVDSLDGKLVSLVIGLGDRHNGGRAVAELEFDSGCKLIYKPRPARIDAMVSELLSWLAEREPSIPRLRVARAVDAGDHSWHEFVEPADCRSADEVAEYFRRVGGWLAVLYVLGATDMHHENVIACGADPVPVDLETILHPRLLPRALGAVLNDVDVPLMYAMIDSVLRIGLLPVSIWGAPGQAGVDLSGMGADEEVEMPIRSPTVLDPGLDTMRMSLERRTMNASASVPRFEGQRSRPDQHQDAILRGFGEIYDVFDAHAGSLLESGPLSGAPEQEVRVLYRDTMEYWAAYTTSFHPDLCRDMLDREIHLGCLWESVDAASALALLHEAEHTALLNNDVPHLTAVVGSDVVRSGDEAIAGLCEASGWDLLRSRLLRLGHADRALQLWYIRAALATYSLNRQQPIVEPAYSLLEVSSYSTLPEAPSYDGAEAVDGLARWVAELAITSGSGSLSWATLKTSLTREWHVVPASASVYDGSAGVAIFMAYASAACQSKEYEGIALGALRYACDLAAAGGVGSHGALTGPASVAYATCHVAAALERQDLLDVELPRLIDAQEEVLDSDEAPACFDIVAGVAGTAAALSIVAGAGAAHRARCESLIERCLPALQQGAVRQALGGVAWPWRSDDKELLLNGFGHGAAGIVWVLAGLASVTGDAAARDLAMEGLAFEDATRDPVRGCWRDLRPDVPPDELLVAWCHGAAGIGLARAMTGPLLGWPDGVKDDVRAAGQRTLEAGFGGSDCLCHGAVGNLFVLERLERDGLLIESTPPGVDLADARHRLLCGIAERVKGRSVRCGIHGRVEVPGLFSGLAGVGLAFVNDVLGVDLSPVAIGGPPAWRPLF